MGGVGLGPTASDNRLSFILVLADPVPAESVCTFVDIGRRFADFFGLDSSFCVRLITYF